MLVMSGLGVEAMVEEASYHTIVKVDHTFVALLVIHQVASQLQYERYSRKL